MSEFTIQILHTHFDSMLAEHVMAHYFSQVPLNCQAVINRYVRWQDRQSVLLGKMLLLKALRQYMGQAASLETISRTAYGRPFIADCGIDFNISHSGGHVVCAITESGRVGIDIETIRSIELSDFKTFLTSKEWNAICNAEHPGDMFFSCWTKKESVMKADGKGLSIPLHQIVIEENTASVDTSLWFLYEIIIAPHVKCHLASDTACPEIVLKKFDCYQLLEVLK
ncbi:MAG TPA: 4'-phosphopantetheinyl transferase superfamily protein [Thermodesulfovibrionia bacterium]|nr:4'-phosphopantetheinyl transferase superfamily protein [Thermodesulfovibrionia bacterium]